MSTSKAPQELNSSLRPQLELEELDLAVIVMVLIGISGDDGRKSKYMHVG